MIGPVSPTSRAMDVRVGHVVRGAAAGEVDAVDVERELEPGAREVEPPVPVPSIPAMSLFGGTSCDSSRVASK